MTSNYVDPRRRYRSDDRDLDGHDLDLVILPPSGNGDWYVSVLPHGHKSGPAVRVTTSGSPPGQHGVCIAVARLYRALGGEEEPSLAPFGSQADEQLGEGVPAPADLHARIEVFRQQEEARTKQPLDEAGAVRLLLLRGLAAALGERTCPRCGGPFPPGKRRHAKWCKRSCGKAEAGKRAQERKKAFQGPMAPCS